MHDPTIRGQITHVYYTPYFSLKTCMILEECDRRETVMEVKEEVEHDEGKQIGNLHQTTKFVLYIIKDNEHIVTKNTLLSLRSRWR